LSDDFPPFAVVNPWGRDRDQLFPDGPGAPGDPGHPPVNFHAFAACLRGAFLRDPAAVPRGARALLLIRSRVGLSLEALRVLRGRGAQVWVSWKEAGLAQVAQQLADRRALEAFGALCSEADGAIAVTPDLEPIYRAAGARRVAFVPTPYPVDDPRWDFGAPAEQREGALVGTREWEVPQRNHAAALLAARELGAPFTVVNTSGARGRARLQSLAAPRATVVDGPLPYPDWLRLIARHRCVLQFDRSAVPGQVAGDALLARTPCVGGDGAVERIAFPETHGFGRTFETLLALARRVLDGHAPAADPGAVSFSTVARTLKELFR
jgi:hypothetical protein